MTDDERQMLHALHERLTKDVEARHLMANQMMEMLADIREMKKQAQQVNTYLMEPTGPGKPSRAEAMDGFLDALAAGKLFARLIIWAAGLGAAVIALVSYWRGVGQ